MATVHSGMADYQYENWNITTLLNHFDLSNSVTDELSNICIYHLTLLHSEQPKLKELGCFEWDRVKMGNPVIFL